LIVVKKGWDAGWVGATPPIYHLFAGEDAGAPRNQQACLIFEIL